MEQENTTTRCRLCDQANDDLQEVNFEGSPRLICRDCLDDLHVCERCDTYTESSNSVTVYRRLNYGRTNHAEQIWCIDCVDNHAFACVSCDETWENDRRNELANGDNICQSCLENGDYSSCANCGDLFHCDDLRYSEADEESYCERCYSRLGPIHGYHSVNPCQQLGFFPRQYDPKTIYYGIELEVQCNADVINTKAEQTLSILGDDFVLLEEDGSIRSGFEIITAPATLEVQKEKWNGFLTDPPSGLSSWRSGACGIHIHVSRKPLSQLTIGKLIIFLNDPKNEEFVKAIAGRYSTSYCKVKYDKKASAARHENYDRYEALNLTNTNTIEFRIFRGTLDKVHFLANLEFVASLIQFVRQASVRDIDWRHFTEYLDNHRKENHNLITFLSQRGYVPRVAKTNHKKAA